MQKVKIGERFIGDEEPVFIVAEIGLNHDGKLHQAKELIKKAAEAGVDAVKFQTFHADKLLSRSTRGVSHLKMEEETPYKMFKKLEFGREEHIQLMEVAREEGILFLSTPFDEDGAELLFTLGVKAFKIASGDITNLPLLEFVAKKKLPIILSTGMSTLGEVEEAIDVIYGSGCREIVLLHCTSNYPPAEEDVNLRAILLLKEVFGVPVGYSDHTVGIFASFGAVSLGASLIEKHFTLSRTLPGPDHSISLEPKEMKQLVIGIRSIEKMLGEKVKRPAKAEFPIRNFARRSIVASVKIPKGTVIQKEMLSIKRPGSGIPPKYINLVVGRVAKSEIEKDELLRWDKLG
jgi:N-acetylneuraminate synthase/N,N'-diacetyllegionaminate synthase